VWWDGSLSTEHEPEAVELKRYKLGKVDTWVISHKVR